MENLVSTSIESGRNEADIDTRPNVIQEPEENKTIKTIMEELEAIVLFIHWPNKKFMLAQT